MEKPIAYLGDQPYIFISYSHRDSEQVWPIILKLQAEGFRIWYDDGISPGTEWDANIAKHIRKCSFFMAFISHNYLGSDNCKDELSFVRELNKNRVLIYLEEVSLPDEMQMRLGRLQAIYWNRDGEKKSHQKLMLSPGLNICREPAAAAAPAHENHTAPAAVNPAAPAHENPAAPPPETPAAPSPEVKTDVKPFPPKSETGDVTKKPAAKKNPILFAGIGAVILLILVFALKPKKSPQSGGGTASTPALEYESVFEQDNSREDAPAENNSEDAAVADGDEASEEDDETDVEGDETGVEGDGTGVEGDGTGVEGMRPMF